MSYLRKLEHAFWRQSQNLVTSNEKFHNVHKGETCYILGNGGSLKYFDLSVLSNATTIGCTYSLMDNRLSTSSLNYCVFPSAYLMYPLWKKKNLITGQRIQLNALSPIFKKLIKENNKTHFFVSLTDRYSFLKTPENMSYIYHFGKKEGYSFDMAGAFSLLDGGLDAMIGIAKYLGFSKLVLLGCDYLGSPCLEGHFYSTNDPAKGIYHEKYANRIRKITDNLALDVLTIFPEGVSSPLFKSKSFLEYFGIDEQSYTQSQLINEDYMELLKIAHSKYQVELIK